MITMISRIRKIIEKRPYIFLYILILGFIVMFSLISYFRYYNFTVNWAEDTAIYNQNMWNLINTSVMSNTIYSIKNFLGYHFSVICYLLAPVYYLFQNSYILLFIQVLLLGLAGIAVFKISRLYFNNTISLIFTYLYLSLPTVVHQATSSFHESNLSIFFISFTLLYYFKNKFWRFLIFILLACFCKEDISPMLTMFGILALFNRRKLHWIIVPISLGIIYFVAVNIFIMPTLPGGGSFGFGYYSYLGNSSLDILKNVIFKPFDTLKIILMPHKIKLLIIILGFMVFLPLLAIDIVFIALFQIIEVLFAQPAHIADARYWYISPILPFIMASAIVGFKRLIFWETKYKILSNKVVAYIFLLPLIIFASVSLFWGIVKTSETKYLSSRDIKTLHSYINQIPSNSSVCAQDPFLPNLSSRKDVFMFPYNYDISEYIVIDKKHPWPLNETQTKEIVEKLKTDKKYSMIKINEDVIIFRNVMDFSR